MSSSFFLSFFFVAILIPPSLFGQRTQPDPFIIRDLSIHINIQRGDIKNFEFSRDRNCKYSRGLHLGYAAERERGLTLSDRPDAHKFPRRRHFSSDSDYLFTGRRARDGRAATTTGVCARSPLVPRPSLPPSPVTVIDNNASLTSTGALILLKHNLRS